MGTEVRRKIGLGRQLFMVSIIFISFNSACVNKQGNALLAYLPTLLTSPFSHIYFKSLYTVAKTLYTKVI